MIEVHYAQINQTIWAVSDQLGEPFKTIGGRTIGIGAVSKAKWMGPGWIMWTDHFRGQGRKITVKCFLSFEDPKQETLFKLKYPELTK